MLSTHIPCSHSRAGCDDTISSHLRDICKKTKNKNNKQCTIVFKGDFVAVTSNALRRQQQNVVEISWRGRGGGGRRRRKRFFHFDLRQATITSKHLVWIAHLYAFISFCTNLLCVENNFIVKEFISMASQIQKKIVSSVEQGSGYRYAYVKKNIVATNFVLFCSFSHYIYIPWNPRRRKSSAFIIYIDIILFRKWLFSTNIFFSFYIWNLNGREMWKSMYLLYHTVWQDISLLDLANLTWKWSFYSSPSSQNGQIHDREKELPYHVIRFRISDRIIKLFTIITEYICNLWLENCFGNKQKNNNKSKICRKLNKIQIYLQDKTRIVWQSDGSECKNRE